MLLFYLFVQESTHEKNNVPDNGRIGFYLVRRGNRMQRQSSGWQYDARTELPKDECINRWLWI
ncbi:MAG: hypothetical protein IJM20_04680 [Clostridia bacterium]|nr:hypothetical protein [Clostridia bacterium]